MSISEELSNIGNAFIQMITPEEVYISHTAYEVEQDEDEKQDDVFVDIMSAVF